VLKIDQLGRRVWAHGTLARFAGATTFQSVVTMLAGFAVLRWVSPDDLGLWQSFLLIESYSLLVQVGVFNGLNRELPFQLGANNATDAMRLAATSQTVAAFGSGLLAIGTLIAVFSGAEPRTTCGVAAVFFASACGVYQNYLTVTYRADRAFETLARLNLLDGILGVVSLPLVFYLGYVGLALRYALMKGISVTLNHLFRPMRPGWGLSWRTLVSLLRIGVPLYTSGYLLGVSVTFPKVILLSEHGPRVVGLFAPAGAMMAVMQILPGALGQFVYPRMSFALGRTNDPASLWPIVWKTTAGTFAISIPVAIVGMWLAPWFISGFFPKYTDCIPAIRWTIATGVLLGSTIGVNALYSLKAWRPIVVYTAVRVCAAFVFPYLMIRTTRPLEGIALGYFIGESLSFVVGAACVYWAIFQRSRRRDAFAATAQKI
jgi:O-antigen/teichoic acid export membrane protein